MSVDLATARTACAEQLGINLDPSTVRAWRTGGDVRFVVGGYEYLVPQGGVVYSTWLVDADPFVAIGWVAGGALERTDDVSATTVSATPPVAWRS